MPERSDVGVEEKVFCGILTVMVFSVKSVCVVFIKDTGENGYQES